MDKVILRDDGRPFLIENIRSKTVEQSQKGYTDTGSLCPISCFDTKYFIGEHKKGYELQKMINRLA